MNNQNLFCDAKLKDQLPHRDRVSYAVLNPHFGDYQEHIHTELAESRISGVLNRMREHHKTATLKDVDNYRYGEHNALLKACQEHRNKLEKPLNKDNVLLIAHPFYLFLGEYFIIDPCDRKDAEKYKQNLLKVFSPDFPRDRINLVLFETAHHYAAASSLLLEEGLVDKVFFTSYGSGKLLESEWEHFIAYGNRKFFIGGSYNGLCITGSFIQTSKIAKPVEEKNFAVQDLILNHWILPILKATDIYTTKKIFRGSKKITMHKFKDRGDDGIRYIIPKSQVLTLDELLHKL